MKFKDLRFNGHPIGDGVQATVFFKNGYGASVIRFSGSYGNSSGLWELAVTKGAEGESGLCYDTDITDDVLGYLSENEVSELLVKIEQLPCSPKYLYNNYNPD